ncbi:MAG: SEC-C domain-containing protein [Parachlamydia sp.]|nr:SEC-C domain-containing protein [Parachlamydia sp.]
MNQKAGRNDPCPCGSGKKFKNCCMNLERPKPSGIKRKISAKVLTVPPKAINLIERTYGQALEATEKGELPPSPKE